MDPTEKDQIHTENGKSEVTDPLQQDVHDEDYEMMADSPEKKTLLEGPEKTGSTSLTNEDRPKSRAPSGGSTNQTDLDGAGKKTGKDDEPLLSTRDSIGGRDLNDPDLDTMIDLPAELPPPPDGGWGWVIVIASFFANMVVDGVAYSFSPFLPIFSEAFDEPQGKVAWISSLLAGVYLSAGPIVSALSNRFGCRVVCMVGAVIASLAFLVTIVADSVSFLMVTQGLVGGFGFGLVYLPAVVCVGYYFEKKRALATGIAVCGSGVGTMVFPPLVKYLIETVGWRYTNVVIAALILHCCAFGALMRPLSVPRMTKRDLLLRLEEEERELREATQQYRKKSMASNGDPGVSSHLNLGSRVGSIHPAPTQPTIQEQGIKGGSKEECDGKAQQTVVTPGQRALLDHAFEKKNVRSVGSVPNFERKKSRSELVNVLKVVPATSRASSACLAERRGSSVSHVAALRQQDRKVSAPAPNTTQRTGMMLRPMSRQDIFYTGSIASLNEYKSQLSMVSYRESTLNLQGTGASTAVKQVIDEDQPDAAPAAKSKCPCIPESIVGTLSQMMDFSLLKDPVFLLVGVANVFGMLGFYTPYVYLPGAAMEKGVDPSSATFLVSIIGITNTIGRVLSGLIADMEKVNALYVNNICVLASGICVMLTPLASTYGHFVTIAIFFGFFVSGYISLTSIILVELLGLNQLTNAFGLLILFRGSASMVGPPLSGSIYDASGSYTVSFVCSGILLLCCSTLHCLVPFAAARCSGHRPPVHYTTNVDYMEDQDDHPGGEEHDGITIEIRPKEAQLSSISEGQPV